MANTARYARSSRLMPGHRVRAALHAVLLAVLMTLAHVPAARSAPPDPSLRDLLQLDITDLMELPVMLASREEETQFTAPAAVYVITQEDIRRSGLRRIPELLRLVPGLHVGKVEANMWAISSRSELSRFSDTMLVLMDGRTLYTPLFSGVYWDVQDTLLDDIERIEVIRGPGAALWGANAVDGVINIVTKNSAKTNGGLAYGGVGAGEMKWDAGARYGGRMGGNWNGRIYGKAYQTDTGKYLNSSESNNDGDFPVGSNADDDGRFKQTGFRTDWQGNGRNTVTLQGDVYSGTFHDIRTANPMLNTIDVNGYNLLARWSRSFSPTSVLQLQAYYDSASRKDLAFNDQREIADIDLQHSFAAPRQQFVWGLGFRRVRDDTQKTPTGTFELEPPKRTDDLTSAFIQDRIAIEPTKLFLILGLKLEDNDYTDSDTAPSARLLWTPDKQNTFWAAASRAVRLPNRSESDAQLNFGGGTIVPIGNANTESYSAEVYELGYRRQFTPAATFDVALFQNNYKDTYQPGINSANGSNVRTYGAEVVGRWRTSADHRLEAWYAYHRASQLDTSANEVETTFIPRHSAHLRSYWDISSRVSLDNMIYYVDGIRGPTITVPSYVRLDTRVAWRPMKQLETSVMLTNMFDEVHPEATEQQRINTGVKHGIFLQATYAWN